MNPLPLVVHLIYRLDYGGLETLLVECINRMPANKYRHAIVCLTDYTEFARKITAPDVQLFALNKPPGLGLGIHADMFRLLRKLKPAVIHTYNLPTVEYQFVAWLTGVPVRIHAEHGRDITDPEGRNWKHNLLRRMLRPVIDCFVPVSQDLQRWLKTVIAVPDQKNRVINNGVDTSRFDRARDYAAPADWPFGPERLVVGTVGRIQEIKDHKRLVEAFILLRKRYPQHASRLALAIVGDGPLLPGLRETVKASGLEDQVWLPGARSDIPQIMHQFSIFAMSSIAEGTPVVVLEAMSSALPVVSTRVGGIGDVAIDGQCGTLVPASDTEALANALGAYLEQPALIREHGDAGRTRASRHYSVDAMVAGYENLYDGLIGRKTLRSRTLENHVRDSRHL